MNVLVCDDHAVFGESLALVLGRANYHVTAVTRSIDEALTVLRRFAVDVCLLDVMFARADGAPDAAVPVGAGAVAARTPGTLRRLPEMRAAAPGARFVLLSGHLTRELVEDARTAGVRGFAHKGCHIGEIVSTIARVHAGEVVIDSRVSATRMRPVEAPSETQRLAGFLTAREREVLGQLVLGADTTTLAKTLGVSWTTARSHIQSVLTKLGMHSRLEAATSAVRHGIVSGASGEWLL
jgi:DNA-binding NarL/FixJ family response regulator